MDSMYTRLKTTSSLSGQTYIERILQTHGWEKPSPHESDRHDTVPIPPDYAKTLTSLQGPVEGTREHAALEKEIGFSYRQVLGEVIYAYVVCRLDIGFAATLLSCFAQAPHHDHYIALKGIVKYLRCTKDWGIVYW